MVHPLPCVYLVSRARRFHPLRYCAVSRDQILYASSRRRSASSLPNKRVPFLMAETTRPIIRRGRTRNDPCVVFRCHPREGSNNGGFSRFQLPARSFPAERGGGEGKREERGNNTSIDVTTSESRRKVSIKSSSSSSSSSSNSISGQMIYETHRDASILNRVGNVDIRRRLNAAAAHNLSSFCHATLSGVFFKSRSMRGPMREKKKRRDVSKRN